MKPGDKQFGKYMAVAAFTALTLAIPARAEAWMVEAMWNWAVNTGDPMLREHEAEIQALQAENDELRSRLEALEASFDDSSTNQVANLAAYVTVDESDPAKPVVRFAGVNVQIVNGTGFTESTNGLGNLIVGYDEERDTPVEFWVGECSGGIDYSNQAICTNYGFEWDVNHKTGSHNVVIGYANNYAWSGGLVTGSYNSLLSAGSAAVGGHHNIANGSHSFVGGGFDNVARGSAAAVMGGNRNEASGNYASVSGGYANEASGDYSSISGGEINVASGTYASVTGGRENEAAGRSSSVNGGGADDGQPGGNVAYGDYSTITGGFKNRTDTSGGWSTVTGGAGNVTSGNNSSVSGGLNRTAIGPNDWAAGAYWQNN